MTGQPPTRHAVRPAAPADLPSLGRLAALLVQQHHDLDARRFIAATPQTPSLYASFLGEQLDERGAVLLVAEVDGRVVGYAYGAIEGYDYMALRGPAAILHDLIVEAPHRNRGIGEALFDAAFAALLAHGAPRVVLSTAARNDAAQRFFERLGFRRTMIELTRDVE